MLRWPTLSFLYGVKVGNLPLFYDLFEKILGGLVEI